MPGAQLGKVAQMAAHKPWTPQMLAELRQLWKAGVSGTKIGLALGMTKNAVIGKARREGLPARDGRFAADLAIKPVTEEQRETVRSLWMTHSVPQIRAITRIGWRRVIAIAADLSLPSRAELIIAKNKASPRRKAEVSGASFGTPRFRRAARTRAVSSAAPGGRVPSPPPGATLPADALLPAPQHRRVFSAKCKFPLWRDKEAPTHRYCEALATMGCYCEDHALLCYIGTNESLGKKKENAK